MSSRLAGSCAIFQLAGSPLGHPRGQFSLSLTPRFLCCDFAGLIRLPIAPIVQPVDPPIAGFSLSARMTCALDLPSSMIVASMTKKEAIRRLENLALERRHKRTYYVKRALAEFLDRKEHLLGL
jgi:hypothetical protein